MEDTLVTPCVVRSLSDLPDELLSHILSMLPTKEAAVMQVVSKRMRHAFEYVTSIDLDDWSEIRQSYTPDYHIDYINDVEHSPLFVSFIDNFLLKRSQFSQPLTRFRLHLGRGNFYSALEPDRIYKWISYPLAQYGLKELDLEFYVIDLPPGILSYPSLEVLILDSADLVIFDDEIPHISLPNLKILHLRSFKLLDTRFVTRLALCCPRLEHLFITCCKWALISGSFKITSLSLRRLKLDMRYHLDEWGKCRDRRCKEHGVYINTPNLQFLEYDDCLPYVYKILPTNALVEAHLRIESRAYLGSGADDYPFYFDCQLELIRSLSHVRHLSLLGYCAQNVYYSGERLLNMFPTFPNVRTLELDTLFQVRWDLMLLLILDQTPILETLAFPRGLCVDLEGNNVYPSLDLRDRKAARKDVKEEAKAWMTNETITPPCVLSNIKLIKLNFCFARIRELNLMKYFLRKASALEDLIICVDDKIIPSRVQKALEAVPRASNSCSITVE